MNSTINEAPLTPDNYLARMRRPQAAKYSFDAHDAAGLLHWQRSFRSALTDRVGLSRIAAQCTSGPRVAYRDEARLSDHTREHWAIESEPGVWVPFFLLRPLHADEPRPLVITPHGHSTRGRFLYCGIAETDADRREIEDGDRDIALQAVRAGYIAIAPEARAFGDSRGKRQRSEDHTCSCQDWQMRATMLGRSLIGERVWDVMRLIDYAQTRADIDTTRIAITGNSGGGTISLFAAALEPRIKVCVPGSYFCTFADSIGSVPHCACNYFPEMLELCEMADVAGLIAPRPFLAINGQTDPIFPIQAAEQSFQALQRIYTVANATERCQLYVGSGGHRYYKEPAWPFMANWL